MKNILLFLIVIVGLSSCATEGSQKKSVRTAKEGTEDVRNVELINQYFEHFNEHDWGNMVELYTDVADFKDPSQGTGIIKQTRLATSAKFQEMVMEFPDLKRQVLKTIPSDNNTVVVELMSTGTAKDGTKMKLPMRTTFTFQNGKIAKDFSEY